jgi:uncharacterized alkaline shock family protein YloU
MYNQLKQMDTKEVQLPETLFIRDIETKVFQALVLQCLTKIKGVALAEGNLIDYLFGRNSSERISCIDIEQDLKSHSVNIKVEVNIAYGVSIPEKAEEIQLKIVKEVGRLTGLHVGSVHVVFKNLIVATSLEEKVEKVVTEEYSDEF